MLVEIANILTFYRMPISGFVNAFITKNGFYKRGFTAAVIACNGYTLRALKA